MIGTWRGRRCSFGRRAGYGLACRLDDHFRPSRGSRPRLGRLVRLDVAAQRVHRAARRRRPRGDRRRPARPRRCPEAARSRCLRRPDRRASSMSLPDRPVDAIGFSLGAMTLLRLAMAEPARFNRLVLAGVGANVLDPDRSRIGGDRRRARPGDRRRGSGRTRQRGPTVRAVRPAAGQRPRRLERQS